MPIPDTDSPAVTKPARKTRTQATTHKTKFVPYTSGAGDKEMLSPESQHTWMDFWGTLTPKEQAVVGRALNVIITPPIFNEGYRKFFRYWRAAVRDLLSNVKF